MGSKRCKAAIGQLGHAGVEGHATEYGERSRIGTEPEALPTPTGTLLGDWYANLTRVGRLQMVVAVLPIKADNCSIKRILGRPAELATECVICIRTSQADALVRAGAINATRRAYGIAKLTRGLSCRTSRCTWFTEA